MSAPPQKRVSARQGLPVALDATFYRSGNAVEPYAIRRVDIYKSSVRDENLMAQFIFADPESSSYPSPAERIVDEDGRIKPGAFRLLFDVPKTFDPDIYFDAWHFIADGGSGVDINDVNLLICQANRFWVSTDGWFLDDGLEVVRIGFEPLDLKFRKPERRILEVGLTPLPLYDFNNNLVTPLIPQLEATISIVSENCECLVDNEPVAIGLRMGSFRHSPFTIQYLLDTTRFMIGTYIYFITLRYPNGQTRVSEKFRFTIS